MKRNFLFWLIRAASIAGLLLGACAPQAATEPPQILDASHLAETMNAPVQIFTAENLLVLKPELISKISPVEGSDTVTADQLARTGGLIQFSQVSLDMVALKSGDILATGVTDAIPYGLLRKVVDVNAISADEVQVQTVQATLEEAIQEGEFSDNGQNLGASLKSISRHAGGRLMMVKSNIMAGEFKIPVNEVLWDEDLNSATTNDRVVAKGEITLRPDYDFYVKISNFKMDKLEFKNKTSVKADIRVESNIEVKKNIDIPIYELMFATKTISVGSLPVVITPKLVVSIGLDGQVSTGISTGVISTNNVEVSAVWENGGWTLPTNYDKSFEFNPPAIKTKAAAKVYARPRLALLLYGVVGPYAQVEGYFKLEASPQKDPWWRLYGGVEAEVGVKFEVFNFLKTVSYVQKFPLYEVTIAQAPSESANQQTVNPIDLPGGSDVLEVVQLYNWPSKNNEYGSAYPENSSYILEALSNTWMGPPELIPISNLTSDFIVEISFEVLRKTDCSLNISLSGMDRALEFYPDFWENDSHTFSAVQYDVRDGYIFENPIQFSDRMPVPYDPASIDLNHENKFTIKRQGSDVSFYTNTHLIQVFQPAYFTVTKISLGIAFNSKVRILNIVLRVPK